MFIFISKYASRIDNGGFHPTAIHFSKLKEEDILWHYLYTKSVTHMHHILMYDDLLHSYQNLKRQNMLIRMKTKEHEESSDMKKDSLLSDMFG